MVQSLTVGTSGGNKAANEIWVGTSGGNKSVTEGWIGTSGGNKQFFTLISAYLQDGNYSYVGGSYVYFNSTGVVEGPAGTDYTWRVSGASADFELYVSLTSGTTPSGSALNTWLSMSSSRQYTLSTALDSCVLAVQIRNATTLAVLATCNVSLYVEL